MENEQVFTYNYSAKKNKEIEAIRNRYLPREISELDMLRKLDADVRRPANVFAYVFGIISAIIMGAGMSLIMTEIGEIVKIENTMPVGIVIGVIGLILALINYPIYKTILNSRKRKYGSDILSLSDKILN